jgi:hypothetical protein
MIIGRHVLALDARVSRQALIGTPDFTVYSVLFSLGKRARR